MTDRPFEIEGMILNSHTLAAKAIAEPRFVDVILNGLSADTPETKYGCARTLRILANDRPDLLYPRFDFFVDLLKAENNILQWEAAGALSHLVRVDQQRRFAKIFARYFAPIPGPVMITAANVIRGGARIARAQPKWADRIAGQILKVSQARYHTVECRNVVFGHAILALGDFFDLVQDPKPVLRFVKKQLKNPRPATRKKAEQFIQRFAATSLPSPRGKSRRAR